MVTPEAIKLPNPIQTSLPIMTSPRVRGCPVIWRAYVERKRAHPIYPVLAAQQYRYVVGYTAELRAVDATTSLSSCTCGYRVYSTAKTL